MRRATLRNNHLADLVSVDFFVVPTATFRVLYVFEMRTGTLLALDIGCPLAGMLLMGAIIGRWQRKADVFRAPVPSTL